MSDRPDEPRFLKDPPPKDAEAPAKPPASRDQLLAGLLANPALGGVGLRAEGGLLDERRAAARAAFERTRWDGARGWRGPWVEQRFGGLVTSVPGSWKLDADDDRGALWEVPGRAIVTLQVFGFEKKAPTGEDFIAHLGRTDRKNYEQAGARPCVHPHGVDGAAELYEHAPGPLSWPQRWYRFAPWTGTALLSLKLDTDGLVPDDLGADFAAVWAALR